MRRAVAICFAIASASLLSGCYDTGYRYVRNGGGGDAYYGSETTTVVSPGYGYGYADPYYGCCYNSGIGVSTIWYRDGRDGRYYDRRRDYDRDRDHDRGRPGGWNGNDRDDHGSRPPGGWQGGGGDHRPPPGGWQGGGNRPPGGGDHRPPPGGWQGQGGGNRPSPPPGGDGGRPQSRPVGREAPEGAPNRGWKQSPKERE
ncbi:hypothetical protein EC912_10597 [Luteibacter rhizovicinus]|uniref:Uncharacterized protein n=1 Tax=Luteibacter rhizovicinus TaxID=242606 RepID=A0A4R3YL15_9GAMM|nr:hypothetical protein [Luteibacter rhizovicinus]TCV93237.1 hypothetical protein EC912_10597 [Luteibacter rhizovicinus]